MGATHIAAFASANSAEFANELVAVCDRKASRRAGELGDVGGNLDTAGRESRAFDPSRVRGYERPEDLIADPNVDLISVCTRTDTHVDLCIRAMEAGKHVIVEKPLTGCFTRRADMTASAMQVEALRSADAMLAAARDAGRDLCYAENWLYARLGFQENALETFL